MVDGDPAAGARQILGDVAKAFAGSASSLGSGAAPLLGILTALAAPLLEGQRAFLGWYQKALEEEASTHALEEHLQGLGRSFFAAYLEFARAQREHGHALMQVQAEVLKSYLAMVDEALGRVDGGKA